MTHIISEDEASIIHEFCFHGVLRLKLRIEHYLYLDNNFRERCIIKEGAIEKGYWDFQEIFLQDISNHIYKIFHDPSSKLSHKAKTLIEKSLEAKVLFEEAMSLAPSKDDLEKCRHNRIAHLGHVKVYRENLPCYSEEVNVYKALINARKDGTFPFYEKLEAAALSLLKDFSCDIEAFQEDIFIINTGTQEFWKFVTTEFKDE